MKSILIGAAVVLLLITGCEIAWWNSSEVLEVKVTEKERIVESNGDKTSSKYLVFTENETFENVDVMFLGKWNSSDIQGKFKLDSTYKVKVYGWRIPFISMYRNITEIIE